MKFRYSVDDRPPLLESVLIGLQFCAIVIPWIIILGTIAGAFHFENEGERTVYLQKLFFAAGLFTLVEILAGHRLPLVFGPSTVILIGIISSVGFDTSTIYTSALIGSVLLTVSAVTGIFGTLRRLFTPRVVSVVLLLVSFCMTPTVVRLVTDVKVGGPVGSNLSFALVMTLAMITLYRFLKGIGRSTLIVGSMFAATLLYFALFPGSFHGDAMLGAATVAPFFTNLTTTFSFDAGLTLSFIICYIALSINDLGSIQSMNALVLPPDMPERINRGVLFTGVGNIVTSFLGVAGQVNYSLSLGVVLSSGSLSRWTLVPASLILLAVSFSPMTIALLGSVPPVIIGSALAYILTTQVAGGLTVLIQSTKQLEFEDFLVLGLPLIIAVVIAFLPTPVVESFPALIRPVVGNSFVMGVLAVVFMEHVIFRA
ncbi:MAG: purine/pyrimidine permease [Deltaproteobacteria bacterium]|nr:purine/pyrimidine permease [Deltaproteobacteria bacterium]